MELSYINCEETESFENGSSSPFREDYPIENKNKLDLSEWLMGACLLKQLSDDTICSCFDDILKCYESKREIVNKLIKSSTTKQIQKVVNILKLNAKNLEKKENEMKMIKKNNKNNTPYFDYLSILSVYNIMEFLENEDILKFKLCSTFISLVALDCMKCIKIGCFNMSELTQINEYKFPLHLDLNKKIKINFIKPFSKYKALTLLYSKRYNICMDDMMILQSYKSHGWDINRSVDGIYKNSLCKSKIVKNITKFNQCKIEKGREFFIFDKQKVLVLNNKYKKLKLQTMSTITEQPFEINEKNDHYNIVLLQYFDVNQQRLQNLHYIYLCFKTELSIFEQYIYNDLYSIYTKFNKNNNKNESTQWLQTLYYTMEKMKQFIGDNDCGIKHKLINIYLRKRQILSNNLDKQQKNVFDIKGNS